MQRQTRQLILMRHAHARHAGPSDLERELTSAGLDASAEAGRWLRELGSKPEHALVSAAVRTRQTWQAVVEATGWELEASFDEGLYTSGPDTALDLVRAVPDEVTSLVVLGHNPTMGHLAQLLDDGECDPELASSALAHGYPPGAVSVFCVAGSWAELEVGGARLTGFHVGQA